MTGDNAIGFAGLSHLGIVSSIAAAARGFSVCAYDPRPELPTPLSAGRFPISEPGLDEAFQEHRRRIRYTSDVGDLAACRLIFITLDVRTDEANVSDLAPLRELIDVVARAVNPGAILILMSQVPPGFCRELRNRLPAGLQLFYQVETLIFGNAVERAIRPERYMVGCPETPISLPDAYRDYLQAFECPVLPMRFESAELCKIAINCFLVSSVSTTNMLAEICEKIHADWTEIVPALRLDKRIGQYAYLSPGLGIAGGNLERDLITIQSLAAKHGADAGVVAAWRQNSAHRNGWVLRLLQERGLLDRRPDAQLAVWGIAYKAGTHSTKNSPAVALIRALADRRVQAYDPAVKLTSEDFPNVHSATSALEAVEGADALAIMTPWQEFAAAPLGAVRERMRGRAIVDPFHSLDAASCQRLGFDYYRIGV